MRRLLPTVGLLALVAGSLLGPAVVAAQEPITVLTNAPLPLLVDGLATEKLPVAIGLGSQVCVVSAQHYTGEAERWVFQGWSHGPTTECVTLTQPGVYRAVYTHEVVLNLLVGVPGLQKSAWVRYGEPTDVEVSQLVQEGDRVRYRFLQWSDGETRYLPTNRIAPLKPTTLEAKFGKEYLVGVEGLTGSGWYAEGASLLLRAQDVLPGQAATDRLKFARWETVGSPSLLIPDAEKPAITVKVDAPYTLRAAYDKQYRYVAVNPFGTLKDEWQKDGAQVLLSTPPIQEGIPEQERFVFKRWEGLPGVLVPTLSGVIDQPVKLEAVYERQFKVSVAAPHGSSGAGWYKQGATATVIVPSTVEKYFFLQDVFVEFAGYGKSPTMSLVVGEPVDLTALYRREVNLKILALLGILPLGVAGLLVGDWRLRRRLGRGAVGSKRRNGGRGGSDNRLAGDAETK